MRSTRTRRAEVTALVRLPGAVYAMTVEDGRLVLRKLRGDASLPAHAVGRQAVKLLAGR